MKALKVLRLIRQKELDNDEVKYSDYDIQMAVSEVLRYLNMTLADKGSQYLIAIREFDEDAINDEITKENEAGEGTEDYTPKELLDFAATGAPLPEDYVSLLNIERADGSALRPATSLKEVQAPWGEYKYIIFGSRIYTKVKHFTLIYNRELKAVTDFEQDEIDLPDIFLDSIAMLSRMVLNNNDVDTMTQAVTTAVDRLLPRRRYTNSRERMPFYL